eukprot:scaffold480_cov257-Pinguiococcus_pyrenoidosus.AAC.27
MESDLDDNNGETSTKCSTSPSSGIIDYPCAKSKCEQIASNRQALLHHDAMVHKGRFSSAAMTSIDAAREAATLLAPTTAQKDPSGRTTNFGYGGHYQYKGRKHVELHSSSISENKVEEGRIRRSS